MEHYDCVALSFGIGVNRVWYLSNHTLIFHSFPILPSQCLLYEFILRAFPSLCSPPRTSRIIPIHPGSWFSSLCWTKKLTKKKCLPGENGNVYNNNNKKNLAFEMKFERKIWKKTALITCCGRFCCLFVYYLVYVYSYRHRSLCLWFMIADLFSLLSREINITSRQECWRKRIFWEIVRMGLVSFNWQKTPSHSLPLLFRASRVLIAYCE